MQNTETLNQTKEIFVGTEKQIVENFVEKLPILKKEYIEALYDDLRNPERKFIWGEKNEGTDPDSMFNKAILYTLEVVDQSLKDLNEGEQAMLESKARGLMENYGPKDTKSGEALQKIGDHLEGMITNGVKKESIDLVLKNVNLK